MKLFRRSKQELPERRRTPRRDLAEESDTFRRGRTLTGSASSHVRTLSEAQADLKSPRVQAHALTKKRRRLMSALVVTMLLAAGLYGLISQFTAQPVVQASPDTSLRVDAVYAEVIDDYLGRHSSERLRPFTNTSRLTAHLQITAPEVKSVKQRGAVGFGQSLFEITFREPIASWNVDGHQLYVDGDGVPFGRNYFAPPTLRITDRSGMTAASGQTVMSNRFMSFIGQVIGLSEEHGHIVTNIVIPEGMTRQINVELKGIKYPFKFSSDRPAGEGVEDMIRAHKWMQARRLSPEYVDVRVSGRAFYR